MLHNILKRLKSRSKRELEQVDSKPLVVPVLRQVSLQDRVRQLIADETFRRHLAQTGTESFEEAEDFDVGDDLDPSTPYELEFDPGLNKEVYKHEKKNLDADRALAEKELKKAKNAFKQEKPKKSEKDEK